MWSGLHFWTVDWAAKSTAVESDSIWVDVQTMEPNLAWSRRFIPKLFVWHSSGDIVRMKWRYCRAGYYPYLHFILTISPEECQTKSFGMNLLLHAIFKFCTTKRLFRNQIFLICVRRQQKLFCFAQLHTPVKLCFNDITTFKTKHGYQLQPEDDIRWCALKNTSPYFDKLVKQTQRQGSHWNLWMWAMNRNFLKLVFVSFS